jgi:hypothetical protein
MEGIQRQTCPGHWRDEATGVLRPVVLLYLAGGDLSPWECAVMRAYIRQWVMHSLFDGDDEVAPLRVRVDGLVSRDAIDDWMRAALAVGIDIL